MGKDKKTLSEEKVQEVIGQLLRTGVFLAAGFTLIGGILYLLRYGNIQPDYHVFRGEPADLRSISGIFKDFLSFRSRGIIQFGLLVLIATPVMRVAFSILAFILQRDVIYTFVTIIVLIALIFSIAGAGL